MPKTFTPTTIASGGTSTITFTVNNFNASTLTGIDFTDNLPAGMTVAATPNAATTCAGATVSAVAGASSFSVSGGSLAGVAANAGIIEHVVHGHGERHGHQRHGESDHADQFAPQPEFRRRHVRRSVGRADRQRNVERDRDEGVFAGDRAPGRGDDAHDHAFEHGGGRGEHQRVQRQSRADGCRHHQRRRRDDHVRRRDHRNRRNDGDHARCRQRDPGGGQLHDHRADQHRDDHADRRARQHGPRPAHCRPIRATARRRSSPR